MSPARRIHLDPQTGTGLIVTQGQHLEIVDPQGEQVSDLISYARADPSEWLSSGRTIDYANTIYLTTGSGLYAVRLNGRLGSAEAGFIAAERRAAAAERRAAEDRAAVERVRSALAVLAAPRLTRVELGGQAVAPSASGRAFWSRDRGLIFTAANLPPLRTDRVYQVWVLAGGAPISAGLLQPDAGGGGGLVFKTPVAVTSLVAVAVTEEPQGGVAAPTGEKYLVGVPASGL